MATPAFCEYEVTRGNIHVTIEQNVCKINRNDMISCMDEPSLNNSKKL